MKKFIIFCLLAAIGAVSFIAKGEARSIQEFCMQNPDLPECLPYVARLHREPPTPPPPPQADQGQPGPPPPQDYQQSFDGRNHDGFDRRHRDGFDLQFRFGEPANNRCAEFSQRLSQQGWRHVRALRCAGQSFVYSAWRDGQSMTLLVSPNSGRIRKIIPKY